MSKSVLDTLYSVKKCLIDSLSVLSEVRVELLSVNKPLGDLLADFFQSNMLHGRELLRVELADVTVSAVELFKFGGMNEGALKRIFKDEEKEAGQVLPRKSCRSFQKCIICLPERPSQVQCIA